MDRKHRTIAVVSVALTLLAVTFVTATSMIQSTTPLYTFRMEQQSSKMNFLSTERNQFTYTIEPGCILNVGLAGEYCSGIHPLDTGVWTCYGSTCGGDTCILTCPESCYGTCNDPTCQATCNPTCDEFTCSGPTCSYPTCDLPTCEETSCPKKCPPP
jgi:hypothetical protein